MTDWPFDPLTPMKYGAILADPPWAYAMRSEKGYEKSPEAHYETMPLADIKALPVRELAGPDCLLFMWSTWRSRSPVKKPSKPTGQRHNRVIARCIPA